MNKPAFVALFLILIAGAIAFAVLSRENDSSTSPLSVAPGIMTQADILEKHRKDAAGKAAAAESAEVERPVIAREGPWPKAVMDEVEFNFGRMQVGERSGQHTFVIRNDGEADLELVAGKATCQCTLFSVEKNRIAPGEETGVVIQWKLESPNPMFRHGGPVYTNDPNAAIIDVAVEGVVDKPLEIFPAGDWNVESVYVDRPGRIQGRIVSRIFDQFEIKDIRANSEHVSLNVNPMSAEMLSKEQWLSGYTIDVEVSTEIPGGAFQDSIQITLDVGDKQLVIPVKARKMGTIKYLPTPGTMFDVEMMLLKLGSFSSTEGKSGKLMLIVNHEGFDEPLQIVSQESVPTYVRAVLEPASETVGNSRRYFLTIEVPPGRPRVQHTLANLGNIKLQTNHPSGEVIQLDLLFSAN